MDYISHKGDRGHDSTETVGSSGRGEAGEGWPGARLSARSPQAREVRGFWKLPGVEGLQRGKKGSKARPEARTPAPGAAGPSRALVEVAAAGRETGPSGWMLYHHQAKRKSCISRLRGTSSFRARGWNAITAVWHAGYRG